MLESLIEGKGLEILLDIFLQVPVEVHAVLCKCVYQLIFQEFAKVTPLFLSSLERRKVLMARKHISGELCVSFV